MLPFFRLLVPAVLWLSVIFPTSANSFTCGQTTCTCNREDTFDCTNMLRVCKDRIHPVGDPASGCAGNAPGQCECQY